MRGQSEAEESARTDEDVRAMVERGDIEAAATSVLRSLGPELLRFLVHAHRDEAVAGDCFSLTAEGIWRGLATFRWDASIRTWAYAIARHVSYRERRRQRRDDHLPLHEVEAVAEIAAAVRTRTLSILRTEGRSKLDVLQEELGVDERMLLTLRIDRGLAWPDIARVFAEQEGGEVDPRAAARLRKRYQLLKERLKARGRELGLVDAEER